LEQKTNRGCKESVTIMQDYSHRCTQNYLRGHCTNVTLKFTHPPCHALSCFPINSTT